MKMPSEESDVMITFDCWIHAQNTEKKMNSIEVTFIKVWEVMKSELLTIENYKSQNTCITFEPYKVLLTQACTQ